MIALSRLLERVEARGRDRRRPVPRPRAPAPGDARHAAARPALEAILGAHPATAELYENLHYDVSGLSRSPLERSVSTELLAAQAIDRAARSSRKG